MEAKTMSIQAECEQCKNHFTVNATNGVLKSKQQFQCGDKIIFLTYYTCPECGKRHYCQIDNSRSNALLADASKQFIKLSRLSKLNKPIPQKQNDKFKKTRRHLAVIRKALMDEYTGKTVVEVSDGTVVENLQFSVDRGEAYESK